LTGILGRNGKQGYKRTKGAFVKMKVPMETVQKLATMLESYDVETEAFLDSLPTPEKYAILAMGMTVGEGYDDYEAAHCDATYRASAQNLTKYLMDYKFLWCHLQDAMRLGPEHFEVAWCADEGDENEDE
jgi:hypothetical protein